MSDAKEEGTLTDDVTKAIVVALSDYYNSLSYVVYPNYCDLDDRLTYGRKPMDIEILRRELLLYDKFMAIVNSKTRLRKRLKTSPLMNMLMEVENDDEHILYPFAYIIKREFCLLLAIIRQVFDQSINEFENVENGNYWARRTKELSLSDCKELYVNPSDSYERNKAIRNIFFASQDRKISLLAKFLFDKPTTAIILQGSAVRVVTRGRKMDTHDRKNIDDLMEYRRNQTLQELAEDVRPIVEREITSSRNDPELRQEVAVSMKMTIDNEIDLVTKEVKQKKKQVYAQIEQLALSKAFIDGKTARESLIRSLQTISSIIEHGRTIIQGTPEGATKQELKSFYFSEVRKLVDHSELNSNMFYSDPDPATRSSLDEWTQQFLAESLERVVKKSPLHLLGLMTHQDDIKAVARNIVNTRAWEQFSRQFQHLEKATKAKFVKENVEEKDLDSFLDQFQQRWDTIREKWTAMVQASLQKAFDRDMVNWDNIQRLLQKRDILTAIEKLDFVSLERAQRQHDVLESKGKDFLVFTSAKFVAGKGQQLVLELLDWAIQNDVFVFSREPLLRFAHDLRTYPERIYIRDVLGYISYLVATDFFKVFTS